MKVEIQNEVIEKLKMLASDLRLEDPWTVGLGIVLWFGKGLDVSFPAMQALGAKVAVQMGRDSRLLDEVVKQQRLPRADERTLRLELDCLTDGQGISLLRDVVELCKIGPATIGRALKSYAADLPSPPGVLPSLTKLEQRKACEGILDLQRQGVDLVDAKNRMATHFSVSLATINRAWKRREKLLAEPTVS